MTTTGFTFTRQDLTQEQALDFLHRPQRADATHGGLSLLGSICEASRTAGRLVARPQRLSPPRVLVEAIGARRDAIAAWHGTSPGNVRPTLTTSISGRSTTIERRHLAPLGPDAAIPCLPEGGCPAFDFTTVTTLTLRWRDAELSVVPFGNLQALHDLCDGEPTQVFPGRLLARQGLVTAVLRARGWDVELTTERPFHADFRATCEALDALDGGVAFGFPSETTVTCSVDDPVGYVTAFDACRWADCRIGRTG